MKKTCIAAIVILGIFSGVAHAQSSVTLYGLIDEGVNYISNSGGHSNVTISSGVTNGSRWGLKGKEDLGSGLSAIFTLENGFDVTNGSLGQGGAMFGRQAYVGLSSKNFGTVTFGRQYDLLTDYLATQGILYETGVGAPLDNDNLDHGFRLANSIKFASLDYKGLKFGGVYAFSNSADSGAPNSGFAANRAWNVGGSYSLGPFQMGIVYADMSGPGSNTTGAITNFSVNAPGLESVTSQKVLAAAVGYTLGSATVNLVYSHVDFKGASATVVNNGENINNYQINGNYQISPATLFSAGYIYTQISQDVGGLKPKFQEFQLMLDYSLSKRTDVYVMGIYQHANGAGVKATFLPNQFDEGKSSTGNQSIARIGLRHRF